MKTKKNIFSVDFGTMGLAIAVIFTAGMLSGMVAVVVAMKAFAI